MPRGRFDGLRLELADGMTVHVFGRPELYEARGVFQLRALSIEPLGLGAILAGLERLKRKLAEEGLFAPERKRPLPVLPRRIGVLTGNEAAAKRDFVTAVQTRFPAANLLVAQTYVQGHAAPAAIAATLQTLAREPEVDVIVLPRGGGSFEDLLPFSDERVIRAVAECDVPVVSAVGHEQDTPLCDHAADVRASTPTAAARLVVPDLAELFGTLDRARGALARNVRRSLDGDRQRLTRSVERLRARPRMALEREGQRLEHTRERLRQAPALAVERKRAAVEKSAAKLAALSPVQTLERGYAIVRTDFGDVVASSSGVSAGTHVDVTLADGGFGARVEDVRP